MITYENITPYAILKKYGIKQIVISWDTAIFICVLFSSVFLSYRIGISNKIEFLRAYSSLTAAISAGILAIVIGALAIITSMINEQFLKAIHYSDSYFDFVVPFYLSSLNWITATLVNVVIYIISYLEVNMLHSLDFAIRILVSISLGILLSGLKGVGDLVITSIGLGLYRNEIISKENTEDKH